MYICPLIIKNELYYVLTLWYLKLLGHDYCVEFLLDQEVFQKMEGNSFSPLHCAV